MPNHQYSCTYYSNYLPAHTFGVPDVSQNVKAGSVVQSPSTWHSSTGAKMEKP